MTPQRIVQIGIAVGIAGVSASLLAQDRADIERTQIIGNRELPKVLYIVPWKKPLPGELSGKPLVSVVDEALASLDRDVFRRQVSYDAQSREQRISTASSDPPPAATKPPPVPTTTPTK